MSMSVGMNSGMYQLLSAISRLDAERSVTMARLATGKNINNAADDPSGLVAMSGMQSSLNRVESAISNNERSRAVLDTADATMEQVQSLVSEIEQLALDAQDPNASSSEIAAYQSSIDSNLDTIDSLINNAEFAGNKLFTGTAGITGTPDDTDEIKDVRIYTQDASVTGNVDVDIEVASGVVTADINGAGAVTIGTVDANNKEVSFTGGGFSGSFSVANPTTDGTYTITITDDTGTLFQLGSDSSTQTRFDMAAGITTAELGSEALGYLSTLRSGGTNSLANASGDAAVDVAKKSSAQVAIARSRVGSFNKYQIGASIAALEAARDGMTDTINSIQNVDYAAETSRLERQNVLMNAAVSMLGMASSSQANVLSLLR